MVHKHKEDLKKYFCKWERLCINKNYSIVDSIISRLYEMCGGIEIKDNDHRMSDSLISESLQNSWDNWSIS